MESIDSSGELSFKGVFHNIKTEKTPQNTNINLVGHRTIEQYQGTFEEWRSSQYDSTRDLYKKNVEIIKEEPSLKEEVDEVKKEVPLNEVDELEEIKKEFVEISSRNEKEELNEDDFSHINGEIKEELKDSENIAKPNIEPKKPSYISSFFWGTLNTVGTGISYINTAVTSNVKSILFVQPKKPMVKEGLSPWQKEVFDYIVKFSRAEESECKEMLEIFKKLPEELVKNEILPAFKLLEELSEKRIHLLMQEKDFDEKDENLFDQMYEKLRSEVGIKIFELEVLSKVEVSQIKKFFEVVFVNVKNSNIQIITDNVSLCYYSQNYAWDKQIDSETLGRHLKGVNSFKENHLKDSDPSMKYLAQNGFLKRSNTPTSCYNSCNWEMEIGKDYGNYRLFEKGYCKIGLAIPGIDLKEVRVPIDLRFLELSSFKELETILKMIKDVIGTDAEGREKYFKLGNMKEKISKGGSDLYDKCFEIEKFNQLVNMLEFVALYANDAVEKGLISLGRQDLHFDGVITLFEVFPKALIERECSKNNEFKNAYKDFLIALHDFRKNIIINSLASESLPLDFDNAGVRYANALQKMTMLLENNSVTEQERKTINNYFNYMVEFSFTGWKENSPLTHSEAIKKILGDWKELLGLKTWPKGMEYEIIQMLSDPTSCRLVADYIHYAKVAKEENIDSLKNNGQISMYAFHNMKMRSLCNGLIEDVGARVEPLKKEKLMVLLGKTLLDAYVKPPKANIESAQNVVEMVNVWGKEEKSLKTEEKKEQLALEELKKLYVEKCISLLPPGFPEHEKNKIIKNLELGVSREKLKETYDLDKLEEISPKTLEKIIEFIDQLKLKQKQGLIQLGFNLLPKDIAKEMNLFIFALMNEEKFPLQFICVSLGPILDLIGETNNVQLMSDTYNLFDYSPQYILNERKEGLRAFNHWNQGEVKESIEMLEVKRDCTKIVFENKFQFREGSDFICEKILIHMEEGLTSLKNKRVFQKGYCQIFAAIPFLGDVRSVRIFLDLTPFGLTAHEDLIVVVEKISQVIQAADKKERIAGFIQQWKEKGLFPEIVNNAELFMLTVLQYTEEVQQGLSKVLNSVGKSNVHFADVEELGDQIPYLMLKGKFSENKEFEQAWKGFLAAAGKGIHLQMKKYLDKEVLDFNTIDYLLKDLEQYEKKLLELVENGFDNKEDLQVILGYIQKIKNFAAEPWDSKNNYQLKMMEKAVSIAAELEIKKISEKSEVLKEMLFPILIEGNALSAFNEWLRALDVAIKANRSSKYDYFDFHNQRLLKKEKNFLALLLDRTDISEKQKSAVAEWMKQQFPKN